MKQLCQSIGTNDDENQIPPNPPLAKGETYTPPLVKGGRGDFQKKKEKRPGTREGDMVLKELRRFKLGYRIQMLYNNLNLQIIITILLLSSAYLYNIMFGKVNIPIWLFFIPLSLSILFSLFRPILIRDIASKIDRDLGLKERLITSLHFLDSKDSYAVLLFQDTLRCTRRVSIFALFPMRWSYPGLLILLLAVTFIFYSIGLVESSKDSRIPYNIRLTIQGEGVRIKELAKKIEHEASYREPLKKILSEKLNEIGDILGSEAITKRDALIMLNDLSSLFEDQVLKGEDGDTDIIDIVEGPTTGVTDTISSKLDTESDNMNTIEDAINLLKVAKRDIAEADISRREKRELNPRAGTSSTVGTTSNAGKGGNIYRSSDSHLDYYRGKGSVGEILSLSNNRSDISEEIVHRQGIIKTYPKSVMSLESLPKKYHRFIMDYFDAISIDTKKNIHELSDHKGG